MISEKNTAFLGTYKQNYEERSLLMRLMALCFIPIKKRKGQGEIPPDPNIMLQNISIIKAVSFP